MLRDDCYNHPCRYTQMWMRTYYLGITILLLLQTPVNVVGEWTHEADELAARSGLHHRNVPVNLISKSAHIAHIKSTHSVIVGGWAKAKWLGIIVNEPPNQIYMCMRLSGGN